MKNHYIFLLFVLVTLGSCTKSGQLSYAEKRMVGSWFYTNVDFSPRWSFPKDITKDYFGQKLTFYNDLTMKLENTEQGYAYTGVWQINQVNAYNAQSNGSSWNNQLVASYEDTQSGSIVQLIWDQVSATKNRINAHTSTKDGTYTIQLKKF